MSIKSQKKCNCSCLKSERLNNQTASSCIIDREVNTLSSIPQPSLQYDTNEFNLFTIDDCLTSEECDALISYSSQFGFTPPDFDKSFRDCNRFHSVDQELSRVLMKRIRPYLPETVIADGISWKLDRFTDHWRYIKYDEGGQFKPHWDGCKMLPNYSMTMFTIQFYLNDSFEGGETRFYLDYVAKKLDTHDIGYGQSQGIVDCGEPTTIICPKRGRALLFNHAENSLLHDGAPVLSGVKYILRGDILYRAEAIPSHETFPFRSYCPQTASRYGTKNFIGQVWVCECSLDHIGEDNHDTSPVMTPTSAKPVDLTTQKKLILLSGKRCSGKDHAADVLASMLPQGSTFRTSLGAINKSLFAAKHGLDLNRLMNDREYKEQYRVAAVAHHANLAESDPSIFITEILKQFEQSGARVLILSDIRRYHDIQLFSSYFDKGSVYLFRIDTNYDAKVKRGWKANVSSDNLITEVELDNYVGWTASFDNSHDGNGLLAQWIQLTVIPRCLQH